MTEVATTGEWLPYAGQSYAELAATAAVLPGGDLVKGDLLIGVPFVITAMTFRVGDYMSAVTKLRGAYVSIEALTGDEKAFKRALKRGRIDEECAFDPEEEIVFNEGGTGAYRQAVQAWEGLGWITLPEGPDGGAYGESRLDTPLAHWDLSSSAPVDYRVLDEGEPVFSAPVRLLCPRGLRVSEYENDYTKEGRTRYFG
jgi:hypothetical protein